MKALIFNSGIGKRMGFLTHDRPKCMVELYNGETILERQIRLLQESGIKDVVVTTGPHEDQIKVIIHLPCFSNMNFTLVNNPLFMETNYIYSMYLAKEYLNDDFIIMHGDLVFDRGLLDKVLKSKNNIGLVNKKIPLPEKDFKVRVVDNKIYEVGINIFEENCYAFQPLYKLDKYTLSRWLDSVSDFIKNGNNNVYAENALNVIASTLDVKALSIGSHFINEVDNEDDLKSVSSSIEQFDYKYQKIYKGKFNKNKFAKLVENINIHKPFIVASNALLKNKVYKDILSLFEDYTLFLDFEPNPKYESMIKGLEMFKNNNCDSIISVGGGSCIDVAKNIKLCMSKLYKGKPLIKEPYVHNRIRHICFPSTCGTGSESTQHSVLYLDGIKQSIKDPSSIPEYAFLVPELVYGLPLYQKKVTSLDAFSQCVESLWAKQGTRLSRAYATKGIKRFLSCYKSFLKENKKAIKDMQIVANLSGKAINIGSTTAAHALSYPLTSKCGLPHGHAVACCLKQIIPIVLHNGEALILLRLYNSFGACKEIELLHIFNAIFDSYEVNLHINYNNKRQLLAYCMQNYNSKRLSNFPYEVSMQMIEGIYDRIIL